LPEARIFTDISYVPTKANGYLKGNRIAHLTGCVAMRLRLQPYPTLDNHWPLSEYIMVHFRAADNPGIQRKIYTVLDGE
jgi:hypothetical protein